MNMQKPRIKKLSCFLISIVIICQIYALEDFSSQMNSFVESFYKAEEIDILNLLSLLQDKHVEYLNTETREENVLYELLFGMTSLSYCMTYYDSEENRLFISNIEKSISSDIRKTKNEKILNQYIKYLYSKIPWAKNSFSIIERLPLWYEKNILFNKSKETQLCYAIWYINAVTGNEVNWISFIKNSENLIYELSLSKTDLFNVYLAYAIFYVKILETQKGFDYLEKADEIFPNSFSVAILTDNFKKGRYGW